MPSRTSLERFAQRVQRFLIDERFQPHVAVADRAVAADHNQKKAVLVDEHRLVAADLSLRRLDDRNGGVVGHLRDDVAGLLHNLAQLIHLVRRQLVEQRKFLQRQPIALHQRIDVGAVTQRRRNPSGRGVRLLEIAHLLQFAHFVADCSTRKRNLRNRRQKFRADRLAGRDIRIDNRFQNLFFALAQFHSARLFSFCRQPFFCLVACFSTLALHLLTLLIIRRKFHLSIPFQKEKCKHNMNKNAVICAKARADTGYGAADVGRMRTCVPNS